jgi:predicted nucleic acid-binding protein
MVTSVATPTLVDTDILIDAGRGVADAVRHLGGIRISSSLAISVVTQMELIVGCRNKTEVRKLERFLTQFQIVLLDASISDKAVELLRHFRLSHGLLIADSLIAATAITRNWSLTSKNQKDYRFIRDLQLLSYP